MSEAISTLKNGNKVLVENQPYLILETEFVNPGKGQAFTRIKIRNLINNKVLEKTKDINAIKLDIPWSDLGSWKEISKIFNKNKVKYIN